MRGLRPYWKLYEELPTTDHRKELNEFRFLFVIINCKLFMGISTDKIFLVLVIESRFTKKIKKSLSERQIMEVISIELLDLLKTAVSHYVHLI